MDENNLKFFLAGEKPCPVRNVLCRFGDKWSLLVLLTLKSNGKMRFSRIHTTIGDISHRMLTVTLRTLESDGLIEREVYAEVPPRVEYCLSIKGAGLMPHIDALVNWAAENLPAQECG
ncbi:MAG: helix-turn-helix transcriptional regulator [Rikenellaceae bacterium]|nr:helix-turn-helix transcriptional regulator [Rikenellaceae bacterium]